VEGDFHSFSPILNLIKTHGKHRWQVGALVPVCAASQTLSKATSKRVVSPRTPTGLALSGITLVPRERNRHGLNSSGTTTNNQESLKYAKP
jgi:hypothetical protein